MGRRGKDETLAKVLLAFARQGTWGQAELARHVGVETKTIHRLMTELGAAGMPLHYEKDHPHVYWSVPKGWFPGGRILEAKLLPDLVRLVLRAPAGPERARLLRALLGGDPDEAGADAVIAPELDEEVSDRVAQLEDAARERRAVTIGYVSARQGLKSERIISVHHVVHGLHCRFVATCHQTDTLRWFRADRVLYVRPSDAAFAKTPADEVRALLDQSFDGYHDEAPIAVSFLVHGPDVGWVTNVLPKPLTAKSVEEGILIEGEVAALLPVARFVVGLGDAAKVHTPALRREVERLANGALDSAELLVRSVPRNREAG